MRFVSFLSRGTVAALRSVVISFLAAGIIVAPLPLRVFAGPTGELVVHGQATFTRSGPATTITTDANTVINYTSFNIGIGEAVTFVQPSASARVLNRIISGDPTEILGSLQGNGIVYLVNPAGMFFGPNAFVDVGGLYAAAGNISNPDFLAGINRFSGLGSDVTNAGTLQSRSTLALLGARVANHGSIVAPGGQVALLSGTDVLLGEQGQSVFVNLGQLEHGGSAVENTGTISTGAGTGSVTLAAGDLYSLAIRQHGSIRSGKVTLDGRAGGTEVNGTIDVSRPAASGGDIAVLGREIAVGSDAIVDASGLTGGGVILVGGDYQGGNAAVRNAERTTVAAGAKLVAEARGSGDGGRVIVWADGATDFAGTISARGGSIAGKGGFAEVSGKDFLAFRGGVDLGAARGTKGTLLLDPANLTIGDRADVIGDNSSLDVFGNLPAEAGATRDSFVTATQVASLLDSANLSLAATNTVTVKRDITWDSEFSLTLLGGIAVDVSGAITNRGSGGVTLTAGTGALTINQPVAAGGTISLTGGGGIALGADVRASVVDLSSGSAVTRTSGTVEANRINLLGAGRVGTSAAPLVTDTALLNLQQLGGGAFISERNAISVQGTSNGAVSLTAAGPITFGEVAVSGASITASTPSGITVTRPVSGAGVILDADSDADGGGTLVVQSSGGLSSQGATLQMTAGDVVLEASRSLEGNAVVIAASAGRSIGVGDATGDVGLNRAELAAIVSNGLRLTSRGSIAVDGVTTSATAATGPVTLESSGGDLRFSGAASAFQGSMAARITGGTGTTILDTDVSSGGTLALGGPRAGGVQVTNSRVQLEGARGIELGALQGSGANQLVLKSGAGTLRTDSLRNLGDLSVSGTGPANFDGAVTISGAVDLSAHQAGAVSFNAGLTAGTLSTGTNAYALTQKGGTLRDAVNYRHTGSLTLVDVTFEHGATAVDQPALTLGGVLRATTEGTGFNFGPAMVDGATRVEANNGPIVFQTLTGAGSSLSVRSGRGMTTFAGTLTGLESLQVAGTSTLNAVTLSTDGGQMFGGPITLVGEVRVMSSNGGAIDLGQIDGPGALAIDSSGVTTFAGVIGGSTQPAFLAVQGPVAFETGRIITRGSQMFGGAAQVNAPLELASGGGASIAFQGSLDGAHPVTVTTTGVTTLGSAVGAATPLARLTIPGPVTFAGPMVATTGAQSYGRTTLGASVVLGSSERGAVTFRDAVDGPHDLTVYTSGDTIFEGSVGGSSRLASLNTDAGGRTLLNGGGARVGAAMHFGDEVVLGMATNLASAGDITLSGGVTGAHGLTVAAGGTSTLGGTAPSLVTVASLEMSGQGRAHLQDVNVTTTGNQAFETEVGLKGSVSLVASGQVALRKSVTSLNDSAALRVAGERVSVQDVETRGGQTYEAVDLELNGAYSTRGGAFQVVDRAGFVTRASRGDLTIDAGGSSMTVAQPLLVTGGGVEVRNASAVALASTVAATSLRVDSPSLTLTGNRYLAGLISYNARSVSLRPNGGGGQPVVLGTADAIVDGVLNVANNEGTLSRTRIDSTVMTGARIDFSLSALAGDPRKAFDPTVLAAFSPSDISTFFASAVPRQSVEVSPETSLSQALREQMVQLGIYARPRTEDEQRAALLGTPVYQQIVESTTADPGRYEVADSRLSVSAVRAALQTYQSIFDGPSRAGEIQQALADSFRSFVDGRSDPVDPASFRTYLERTEGAVAAAALTTVNQLETLFHQIERLGLTNKEVDISKSVLLRPLRVPGLSASGLRQMIERRAGINVAGRNNPAPTMTAGLPADAGSEREAR